MKKNIFILLFLSFFFNTHAQITVLFQVTNPFDFKLSQVSNFTTINLGPDQKFNLKIQISSVGRNIYQGEIGNFLIKSGTSDYHNLQINNEKFQPAKGFDNLPITRQLPSGAFEICFILIDPIKMEEITPSCFNFDILPISPPLLIYPLNESIINLPNPELIWQGPIFPNKENSEFKYKLKLTEVLNRQTPLDAINQNFAIIKLKNLKATNLFYPPNSIPLINGKKYAWQVVAENEAGNNMETEIWTFTYKVDSVIESEVIFFEGFLIPTKIEPDGILNIRNEMKVAFAESYPMENISFEILNENKSFKMDIDTSFIMKIDFNKRILHLAEVKDLKSKTVYYLRIKNNNNNEFFLVKFKYFK